MEAHRRNNPSDILHKNFGPLNEMQPVPENAYPRLINISFDGTRSKMTSPDQTEDRVDSAPRHTFEDGTYELHAK